jgi:hypothetical protein
MWTATAAALLAVGLAAVHRVARKAAPPSVAPWAVAALFLATSLWRTLLATSPAALAGAVSFAAAAVSLWLWWRPEPGMLRRVGAAALWLGALATPYAVEGVGPRPSAASFHEALFASSHGLLFWSPVLWVAVLGLGRLLGSSGAKALVATGALLVVVLAATGPGGEGPLAGGRLHAALPILGVGLACGLAALRDAIERRPALPLVAAGGALVLWNFLFMEQYRTDRIPRDLPVSLADVTETNAAMLARLVGSPTAWPANWLFAWRHGVSPAKYDVVVGQGPWPAGFLSITDERVDPHLLAEGWRGRALCGDAPCRGVMEAARILLPLGPRGPFPTAIRLAGPGAAWVRVNGGPPLPRPPGAQIVDVALPRGPAAWRRGVNEITITAVPPGSASVLGLTLAAAN